MARLSCEEPFVELDSRVAFDWTMLAFITAGIAQGKGRSGLVWFIASLLFGPLALAALVVFFERIPPAQQ